MTIIDTPPQTELVSIEIQDSGCHIKLNREEKFNALNIQMITELCTLFDWTFHCIQSHWIDLIMVGSQFCSDVPSTRPACSKCQASMKNVQQSLNVLKS